MIHIGDKIAVGRKSDGTTVTGTVVSIPKHKRFCVAEYDCPYGQKIRTCIHLGRRRGRGGELPVIGSYDKRVDA